MEGERRRQIERVYRAALERAPEGRSAYLRETCGRDEGLRAEVAKLLTDPESAEKFFAAGDAVATVPGVAGGPAEFAAGQLFDRYRIESLLGAGGMGKVYAAHDTQLMRTVALKFLPAELTGNPGALERFLREARTASALKHPNICTIYDIGQAHGRMYIAMELVEGQNLYQYVSSGPIPVRELLAIAAQLADALAAAHGKGIVHRDIKPANIMIGRDGVVKIVDFGLAKLVLPAFGEREATKAVKPGETGEGVIVGTAGYMSPEQATGGTVDFRSDQFSFGTILYEMATGKAAFQRESMAETLAAILRDEPEPIAQLDPRIPAPLIWLIERCLAKEPGNRWASSRELARELAVMRDRCAELPRAIPLALHHRLPVFHTPLIGRDKEVSAAARLLLDEHVRLVTFSGPPGTGKTRLALQVAAELAQQSGASAFFVSLVSISDPGLVASAIAQALDIRIGGGRSLAEAWSERLRAAQCGLALLVLDNFEQVLDLSLIHI